MTSSNEILRGELLDDELFLTLGELSRACTVHADRIIDIVNEGIIEPQGRDVAEWRFPGAALVRVQCVTRLQRDLGVNLAGAALVLELMDEIDRLRAHLHVLQQQE